MSSSFVHSQDSAGPPYLHGLNDAQAAAVLAVDGPVLVLAGAGTGKTRVLTTRLTHILKTQRAWPSQILAVTFTNRAAQEMRHRVSTLMGGQPVEGWWLGTFHALAARMLRQHAERVGLTRDFTILDPDDQQRLIKQLAEAENIDVKKWPPAALIGVIDRWKDKGLRPDDLTAQDISDVAGGRMVALYRAYQNRMRTLNACDFGDLLLHTITLFRDPAQADVLAEYHRRFKYILVDEYQDTNTAQYIWLRLLAQGSKNICCVGDDDQSIYGWRGAEVGNILRFERDFPGATVVRLEQNYRSTGHILAAASGVIAHNQGRLGKTLWSAGDAGEKVRVIGVWDGETEARTICDEIESLQHRGEKLSSMAILVRAGFQMREIEDRLLQSGIPYRVIGGPRFYERAEVRDAMAYFRAVVQPNDDLALARIINTPKRGLGDTTLQLLTTHARDKNLSLMAAIDDLVAGTTLKGKTRDTLARLMADFVRWRRRLTEDEPHARVAAAILEESGYLAMWQADKSPDAPGRLDNLKELVGTIADYESLAAFLEHVALVMEKTNDDGADAVSLMTLHGAKGLEFRNVFLPGWEDGIFPSQRTLDEGGGAGLEEERRLAYVALTRARVRAVVTFAGSRRQYGNWVQNPPSRFIGELPPAHIDVVGDRGMAYVPVQDAGGRQDRWRHGGSAQTDMGRMSPRGGAAETSPLARGARVQHGSFGPGTIIHVAGNKLDIHFDDGENRRILASFVEVLS